MKISKLDRIAQQVQLGSNCVIASGGNNIITLRDPTNTTPVNIEIADANGINHAATLKQVYAYGSPSVSYAIYNGHDAIQPRGTIAMATETFGSYTKGTLYTPDEGGSTWVALTSSDGSSFIASIDLVDSSTLPVFFENHIYIYQSAVPNWVDNGSIASNNSLKVGNCAFSGGTLTGKYQLSIPQNCYIEKIECNVITAFDGTTEIFKICTYDNLEAQYKVLLDSSALPTPDIDLTLTDNNQVVDCNNYHMAAPSDTTVKIDWTLGDNTTGSLMITVFYYEYVKNLL